MDAGLGNQGGWPHAAMLTDPARRVWWGPAAELAGNGCDDAPDSCVSDGVVGGDKTLSLIAAE